MRFIKEPSWGCHRVPTTIFWTPKWQKRKTWKVQNWPKRHQFLPIWEPKIQISRTKNPKTRSPKYRNRASIWRKIERQKPTKPRKASKPLWNNHAREVSEKLTKHIFRKIAIFFIKNPSQHFWRHQFRMKMVSEMSFLDHFGIIFHPKVIIFASYLIKFDSKMGWKLIKNDAKMVNFDLQVPTLFTKSPPRYWKLLSGKDPPGGSFISHECIGDPPVEKTLPEDLLAEVLCPKPLESTCTTISGANHFCTKTTQKFLERARRNAYKTARNSWPWCRPLRTNQIWGGSFRTSMFWPSRLLPDV